MYKQFCGALLLAWILAVAPAVAHDGNAATSASGQKGLFELIYGENLCHGQWAFSTYYSKWDRRVQSDPATLIIDPLWTDWDMDVERASVAIGYGITDRIELSLMLPYWSYDAAFGADGMLAKGILNGVLFDQGVIDQSGLGNLRVGAKFQLQRTDNYATALMAYVDAPTGDDDEAVVTGDPGLGLTFAYNNSACCFFNLGYFDP
ncbi:MAG: transporter, partial [Holophagales bacterium]|nr:transporter [Holophagales bacterium]